MGWFTLLEWRSAMAATGDKVSVSTVDRLTGRGSVLRGSIRRGKHTLFRALPDRITLATLIKFAEKMVDQEAIGRPGRDSLGAFREVERLTQRQLTRIKTAANAIAEHLVPAAQRKDLRGAPLWEKVADGTLWVWDETATAARGWRRMYDLVERTAPRNRRADDRGAMLQLLDLCATHGLLPRVSRGERFVAPAAWLDVQERWRSVKVC